MDEKTYLDSLEHSVTKQAHRQTGSRDFIDFVLTHVRGRCLEIGCGDGMWTKEICSRCDTLVSMDLSAGRLSRAKASAGAAGAKFIRADARHLPFKGNSFETVCAIEVIEHLPQRAFHRHLLAEISRVLIPSGTLVISTPNKPFFRVYCALTGEKHPTHFSELNYFQFKAVLRQYFPEVRLYGRFGWLLPWCRFLPVRKFHGFLSRFTPLCKGLTGVCRK
ncbi:MAG: class I SAM-dependent methyltransferase [Candidatus Omnitrophota bacterium]|jgi:ubiquinone/menaquinone biosynthesis C-methylase UbiE